MIILQHISWYHDSLNPKKWRHRFIHSTVWRNIRFPRPRSEMSKLGCTFCSLDEEPGYGLFGNKSRCSLRNNFMYSNFRKVSNELNDRLCNITQSLTIEVADFLIQNKRTESWWLYLGASTPRFRVWPFAQSLLDVLRFPTRTRWWEMNWPDKNYLGKGFLLLKS